jgi:hypothetical protein
MVRILARRFSWTDAQIAAAESVILDIPVQAIKGNRGFAVDPVAVYIEAARRA